ncbi:MAG: hypothetical protein RL226_1544 [Bacteroidota bacterium]|jgi:DNA recombination protein RmuC
MDILSLLLGIIVGLIVGYLLFRLTASKSGDGFLRTDLEETRSELKALSTNHQQLLIEKERIAQELHYKEQQIQQLQQSAGEQTKKLEDQQVAFEKQLTDTKAQLQKEFELISGRLISNQTETFTKNNKEQIDQILSPLREQIKTFKEQVDKVYSEDKVSQGEMKAQLKQLMEMNQQLSEGATNLAKALKGDSKTQGDWGESQLEVILQKAGLQKDIHYQTQQNFTSEEGRQRPDFIIRLPENRSLVVDSKVSLTAYERYYSSDDAGAQVALKEHISSIRSHIAQLGAKNYDKLEGLNSPDFVLMYIPIEPALNLAMSNDIRLYEEALAKNVVLVSTSTLLATMRTVSYMWKQEDQRKNVQSIIAEGSSLYEKFVSFTDDMLAIGKHLTSVGTSYEAAMNKLRDGRGNLIGKAEKMRKMGLNVKKTINQQLLASDDTSDDE